MRPQLAGLDSRGYSASLAGLRGVAATLVVVYHALLILRVGAHDDPHRLPLALDEFWLFLTHLLLMLANGSAAVVLFFVLSGTVLALSLARSRRPSLVGFYVKRGFRLYPLLVVATVFAAALHYLYFTEPDFAPATSWMHNYFGHDPGLKEIAFNAVGLKNSLNSPAWTIYIELGGSFLFPLIYALTLKTWTALLAIPALAALALVPDLPVRHLNVFLICFLVGALLPQLSSARLAALPRATVWILGGAALLGLFTFDRLYSPSEWIDPVSVLVQTFCAAVLIMLAASRPGSLLQHRGFQLLGRFSYGLYIVHFPVLFAIAHLLLPQVEELSPGSALLGNLMLALGTLAVALPLAGLLHVTLEKPLQDFGRRLAARLERSRP